MKRTLVVALAVAAFCSDGATPVTAASPALSLTEACDTFAGTNLYGVTLTVTGVAPSSEVSGSLSAPGTTLGGSIFANSAGVATATFYLGPGLYTVQITSPFAAQQSLNVDCMPDDPAECKNGGWQGFFGVFKNQGDCVSFVATGGKNPPAGGP